MNAGFHPLYIVGSLLAAFLAAAGILIEAPLLYGTIPGIIGGIMAGIAAVRFLKRKIDLVGFATTACGFIYYQAFQANPVMLPEFSGSLIGIPKQDQVVGIFLANLTTAMLLIAYHVVAGLLRGPIDGLAPKAAWVTRERCDRMMFVAFWIVFIPVALPNVLFGKVVVGAINNIVYQRMTWGDAENYSGFQVWGGALGGSLANMGLWATSLFLLWIYLLGSRQRWIMWLLGPLILLWTASVVLQGSRTYLVAVAFALAVYYLGNPKLGMKTIVHALWAFPVLFLVVQINTHFRGTGLQSVNLPELTARIFEIRGNEGASSQMDGIEYFRTELLEKGGGSNPVTGLFRGMFERPLEGVLMPVPRSLFPWKADDQSGRDFTLFYQNVRLGVPSTETFLGASPGLIGRELIKYGFLGPFTMLFWMGLVLALAHRLFAIGSGSDFHRIFAALLVAFFIAQSRDFVPVWFIPFLPAAVIFAYIARWARTHRPRLRRPPPRFPASVRVSPPERSRLQQR
jgi:hypothetical protein